MLRVCPAWSGDPVTNPWSRATHRDVLWGMLSPSNRGLLPTLTERQARDDERRCRGPYRHGYPLSKEANRGLRFLPRVHDEGGKVFHTPASRVTHHTRAAVQRLILTASPPDITSFWAPAFQNVFEHWSGSLLLQTPADGAYLKVRSQLAQNKFAGSTSVESPSLLLGVGSFVLVSAAVTGLPPSLLLSRGKIVRKQCVGLVSNNASCTNPSTLFGSPVPNVSHHPSRPAT
eukprot:3393325-Pyramimonas_sp.AAC.1